MGSFSQVCSGTSFRSTRGVAASFLTHCRGNRIFVFVTQATSTSCRGTSRQNTASQMFLQLWTLRRHESRLVAAGVSLSLKDVAASQCVCSCGAATLSSHDSSFRSDSSSTSYQWSRGHEGLRSSAGDCIPLLSAPIQKFFVIGLIVVLSHHRWSLKMSARKCSRSARLEERAATRVPSVAHGAGAGVQGGSRSTRRIQGWRPKNRPEAHGADSASTPRRATIPRTGGQRPKDRQVLSTFLTQTMSSRSCGPSLACIRSATCSCVSLLGPMCFLTPSFGGLPCSSFSCLRASAGLVATTISSILRHPSFWAKELRSGDRMQRRKLRFRLVALTGDSTQSGRRLHNSQLAQSTTCGSLLTIRSRVVAFSVRTSR